MTKDEKVSLRLPADLKRRLEKEAAADNRSLSAYIVLLLQKAVKR